MYVIDSLSTSDERINNPDITMLSKFSMNNLKMNLKTINTNGNTIPPNSSNNLKKLPRSPIVHFRFLTGMNIVYLFIKGHGDWDVNRLIDFQIVLVDCSTRLDNCVAHIVITIYKIAF